MDKLKLILNYKFCMFYITGLCEVESGQSNIILDIEESRGNGKCNVLYIYKYLNLSYFFKLWFLFLYICKLSKFTCFLEINVNE